MKYTRLFYKTQSSNSRESAEIVLPEVFDLVHPASVVDIGCGAGTWLRVARNIGAETILGLDGPWVSDKVLKVPRESFCTCDLSNPPTETPSGDLALCLEVGEHLPASAAPGLVRFLTRIAPVVLFSAAIPGQGGHHHVNEQWHSYWAELFGKQGFRTADCLRGKFWNDERIAYWYRQNMLLFIRADKWNDYPAVQEMMAAYNLGGLPLVHPRHAERALQFPGISSIFKAAPIALARSALKWADGLFSPAESPTSELE